MTATARFFVGDVFDQLAKIEDESIDLVLTSPPFLALRSYLPDDHPDKAKEIGTEPTPAEYLDTLLTLTAEFDRVLSETGSLVVELGDTYSGSGGGGGDYLPGGLREGQPGFGGSAERQRAGNAAHWRQKNRDKSAWPLPKSLVGIPHLFHLSLAYGRNILTGEASPSGQWRVRNVVAWCRPNPPVGALGDKFRPATSYITIACKAKERYFDMDPVRTPLTEPDADDRFSGTSNQRDRSRSDVGLSSGRGFTRQNPKGAPLKDWWKVTTSRYKGAHYATWPPALIDPLVLTMCPPGGTVLDPFAGSGTTLMVAVGHGRNAIGIDLDERNLVLAQERVGPALNAPTFPWEASA